MNISLHITHSCNMKCDYCFNRQNQSNGYMSLSTAVKAIEFCENSKDQSHIISFSGGEPLQYFNIIDAVIKKCNQSNDQYYFNIFTNGTVFSEHIIDLFVKNKFSVQFSMDGIEECHSIHRIPAIDNGWDQILENLKKYLEVLPETMVLVTVNPDTIKYMKENVVFLQNIGVNNISFSFNYQARWESEHFEELSNELLSLSEFYIDQFRAGSYLYLNIFENKIRMIIEEEINRGRCNSGSTNITVSPDGSFYPCFAFVEDHNFKLGDLSSGILYDRLSSYTSLLGTLKENCSECEFSKLCFNWCGCALYLGSNKIMDIPYSLCNIEKTIIPIVEGLSSTLFYQQNQLFLERFYYS